MRTCKHCGVSFDGQQCLPCKRARGKKWREENPELEKAKNARYRALNPEKRAAANAAWYASNVEKQRQRNAEWTAQNKEVRRVYNHNRRAQIRENGGNLSKDIASKLFATQKGLCACCAQPLGEKYHLDHILPIALGGRNEDWNMQLLRQRCNTQKRAKHPIDFMQSRGFLL